VGLRAGLDAMVKKKSPCFCRESDPGRPAHSSILTELLHLPYLVKIYCFCPKRLAFATLCRSSCKWWSLLPLVVQKSFISVVMKVLNIKFHLHAFTHCAINNIKVGIDGQTRPVYNFTNIRTPADSQNCVCFLIGTHHYCASC
jgi:hypothetical protein